jgi:hypothetical protein
MLDENRRRFGPAASFVSHEIVDLFQWRPSRTWDGCMFAFWLAEVPDARLAAFLQSVSSALHRGGIVRCVDKTTETDSLTEYQSRRLNDGREFTIIDHPRTPQAIVTAFASAGMRSRSRPLARASPSRGAREPDGTTAGTAVRSACGHLTISQTDHSKEKPHEHPEKRTVGLEPLPSAADEPKARPATALRFDRPGSTSGLRGRGTGMEPTRGVAGMQRRRLYVLSSLVLAAAALSACRLPPPPPLHPLTGTGTSTAIINLATGTGTADGTGQFDHLGKNTAHTDLTGFTLTGNTFVDTGTATFVVANDDKANDDKANGDKANGDKIFTTVAGTGTVTSTGSVTTSVNTITGGTGRFDDASGTFTITSVGVTVSIVGSIVTSTSTDTVQGQISY